MSNDPEEPTRDSRFRELLRAVVVGEPGAAEDIVSEYGPHILRAVRRRMSRRLRDRFDSEDFAQAVWASFFGHLSVIERIETEGELAGFLGRMASNKVIDAGRRRRVRSEENVADGTLPLVIKDNRLQVSQPTPSQFAMANEQWDNLADKEDDRSVNLLKLRRAGGDSGRDR